MSKRREQIERQQAQQRKQTLTVLVIIAALAVVLIGGAVVLNQQHNQPHELVIVNTPAPQNAQPNGRAWGPADAPIKIIEFVDSQCPGCAQFVTQYEPGVIAAFAGTGKVHAEIRFMTFIGQESVDAAKAQLCAMDQNKFWQMHATVFANQWLGENAGDFTKSNLEQMASKLGLDTGAFNQCLNSTKYDDLIAQDSKEASQMGVTQTPTIFVNGKAYSSALNVDDFKRIFAEVAPDVKLQ